ncbi:hypothetical protein BDP55DRAFT_279585 [Colletotrichum godetiae]|uniref:Uncharacterized protein n=1 Tax=Colletotrichum godetiae TaxID=1209918 RepID=A0AAJ0ADY0_9PEZI|nr:uncharacterized protein BDP55DRAFT_279585 [Colletotrichum godetiae]KAK1672117.1 hypothetical protein BDP55DRAFT_279585 [Colletotrichum godetiae]
MDAKVLSPHHWGPQRRIDPVQSASPSDYSLPIHPAQHCRQPVLRQRLPPASTSILVAQSAWYIRAADCSRLRTHSTSNLLTSPHSTTLPRYPRRIGIYSWSSLPSDRVLALFSCHGPWPTAFLSVDGLVGASLRVPVQSRLTPVKSGSCSRFRPLPLFQSLFHWTPTFSYICDVHPHSLRHSGLLSSLDRSMNSRLRAAGTDGRSYTVQGTEPGQAVRKFCVFERQISAAGYDSARCLLHCRQQAAAPYIRCHPQSLSSGW